ncbi:MAG TPA: ABC-type transport auxiliary lipoprotein family protein, partial [Thermodesulfovibrionales bacterium]|nr:ABC-type transport auxiliary lipoprotein family protein [Thermodesulfovibrionales bacterium]
MRTALFGQRQAIILGVILVMLAGCAGSPPSTFYQLSSLGGQTQVTREGAPDQSLIIAIGPVRMPDYLDRSQIVTRSGKNELKLAE